MIAIIDYGVGNLFSLKSSFAKIGAGAVVTSDEEVISAADHLILPGVGAFEDAARLLRETGMAEVVKREALAGKPIMGICLGMQLLFDVSYEYGEHQGLGLIRGSIRPIADVIPPDYKIPHIGWNALKFTKRMSGNAMGNAMVQRDGSKSHKDGSADSLFKYIKDGDYVYFVHSYYAADCDESVIAVTEYGADLTASVASGNVYGCQFHPEKSGSGGLNILRAFTEL